jgi:hypothetical protein
MNNDQTDVQKYIPHGTRLLHTMAYTQNKVHIAINSLDTDLCYSSHISHTGILLLVPITKLYPERSKTFLHETLGMIPILKT